MLEERGAPPLMGVNSSFGAGVPWVGWTMLGRGESAMGFLEWAATATREE